MNAERKINFEYKHVAFITVTMQYLPFVFHFIDFSMCGCISQSQNAPNIHNDFTNSIQFKFEEIRE